MEKVLLPELGEGIMKASIACWHFTCGDNINADDDLLEVVTDKAAFNIPAGVNGKLKEILVEEGNDALVGSVLAVIEENS